MSLLVLPMEVSLCLKQKEGGRKDLTQEIKQEKVHMVVHAHSENDAEAEVDEPRTWKRQESWIKIRIQVMRR